MGSSYGQVVLITGATSGVGYATAEYFAERGFTVWAAGRSAHGEPRCFNGTGCIIPLAMDVCDEESVRGGVQKIIETSHQIGTVLHCAGMGIAGAAEDTFEEAAIRQLDVNYFGVLRVNRHVLPHMRAAGRGLVIAVSSVAGRISVPFQSHYSSSKFALEAYIEALRIEIRPFGVQATLLELGDTKTGFTGARTFAMPNGSVYRAACEASIAKMAKDEQRGFPPQTAARAAMNLTCRRRPPVRRVVGLQYKLILFAKRLLPDKFSEWVVGLLYSKIEK